ncbi:MAG: 5-formyltetrahydrofolate cyclo-ligase [Tannerellaceae bacterium]|jgi:5-formyltetrahydrofolate cyclo-ligase|nr:5-formyltetrahydrofolate cyclo-ligase [Tannerellaceae bacterium]
MTLRNSKRLLREEMALLRKGQAADTLHGLSQQILDRLERLDLFRRSSRIALYHAIGGEVQTALFIDKWQGEKRILLPVIETGGLHFFPYGGKENLKPGAYGIPEPLHGGAEEEPELIIVPGVAFDRSLNRMGRGKGYYDRFLQRRPTLPRIGLCFAFQLVEHLPVEPFDVKMDLIITEHELIAPGSPGLHPSYPTK